MEEILIILLILSAVWYWWDTQRCNEIALAVCRQQCINAGLQLLDATVTRQRSWLRRAPNGHVQICRLYSFEYVNTLLSNTAGRHYDEREYGYIVLLGKQVVETSMPQQDTGTKTIH